MILLDSLTLQEKEAFFKDYPFEEFYVLNQKMEQDLFIRFLMDKLDNRIKFNPNIWYIKDHEKPIAIFGLAKEIELSNLYNKNIHYLGSLYNFTQSAKEAFVLINSHIDSFCQENSIDVVKTKIDAEDHINMTYLLNQNYDHYASSCKMYYDVSRLGLPSEIVHDRYSIRPYTKKDKPMALKILGQHRQNELYYNRDLAVDVTIQILEHYFLQQSSNHTTTALIMEDMVNKKMIGISLHTVPKYFNSWLLKPLVTWDLIVIDEKSRGNRLGELFFRKIINDTKSDMELSTMSDNFNMLKFLYRLGFNQVGEFDFVSKNFHDIESSN